MSETTAENQPERLIVKNFGPLKDVDIELKDIMVFIGPQASGKSTLAKILYLIGKLTKSQIDIEEDLKRFNINFSSELTEIHYKSLFISISIRNRKLILDYLSETIKIEKTAKDLKKALHKRLEKLEKQEETRLSQKPFLKELEKVLEETINEIHKAIERHEKNTYIPAERNIISNISDLVVRAMAEDIDMPIPKFVLDFVNQFIIARNALKEIYIDLLNISYEYSFETGNRILVSSKQSISLAEAASGIQSVIPLYLVVKHFAESDLLVIEEPELNLFPETQKKLVEFIIETCRDKTKRLIITTHSPYILTTLNGLIQAHNTARTKPELKDKVAEIVPENRWIDFDKIGVYHVADGTVKRIMDDEYRLIDANPIDDVSDKLSREFDELLDLKYD